MYRTAAKRLLVDSLRSATRLRTIHRPALLNPTTFCTSALNQSVSGENPNPNPNQFQVNPADASSSSQSTGSSAAAEEARRSAGSRRPVTAYKEEQARVLRASLRYVAENEENTKKGKVTPNANAVSFGVPQNRLGWTEAALMAGARDIGVSPSIVGSFARKEAELVEYFMDECLERLINIIESDTELKTLIPSECISKLVKIRLEMQAPYVSKWAQALSIQALPMNLPTSFKQRALLIDEIWHAAGDDSTDFDWYVKRTVLGGIYSMTEVYMLTDNSPDFRDTWAFLNARVGDAFDLKKTFQETQYLAEAVSAGLGKPLQGLVESSLQTMMTEQREMRWKEFLL